MCTFEDCGKEGAIVENLGGWITGDDQLETVGRAGLDEIEVKRGRQSVVVVSDESAVIVAIYPNCRMQDLPRILERHSSLWKRPPMQGLPRVANWAVSRSKCNASADDECN
jgi:hypothetical protein